MSDELKSLLKKELPSLSIEKIEQILSFHQLLSEENKVQNLTRLISPEDFFYGHLLDVVELLKIEWLKYPAMDLGSGGGIPGLLAAVIEPKEWVLAESEKKKAEFLERAVVKLGMKSLIRVVPDRAENYLKRNRVQCIVARAVGPVERILGWIGKCSTWNNLILFKGPSWDEEWKLFQTTKNSKQLKLVSTHKYHIGPEEKTRLLIHLRSENS